MPELKEVLFEETNKRCERYKKHIKIFGDDDGYVREQLSRYCVLYELIEKAGLGEEYHRWLCEKEEAECRA